VIDSGLAGVASFSLWSGLRLSVSRISQASANQRAGGRVARAPGRVIRLYPEEDFHRRAAYDTAEIARRELSETCLESAPGARPAPTGLLEAPPWRSRCGGPVARESRTIDAAGKLDRHGPDDGSLSVASRLARMLIEADRRGAGEAGCALAAILSSGRRPLRAVGPAGPARIRLGAREANLRATAPGAAALSQSACRRRGILISVLARFPDRVARRRQGTTLLLAGGGSAVLAKTSVVRAGDWMVAVDIEERPRARPAAGAPGQRHRAGVAGDLFPQRVSERSTVNGIARLSASRPRAR